MTISRMQNPRQMYGLGSLVKKATRGIKKIVKSPLGKAALLGASAYFAPKLWGADAGFGNAWKKLAGSKLGGWYGGLTPGKKIFTGLAAAGVAAPFIQKALKMGPYQDIVEEEEDWTEIPSSILNLRNQARDYYTAAEPDYIGSPFMPQQQYVMPNFYAAEGGRAGLLNGGEAGEAQIEQMLRAEYLKYKNKGGTMPYEQFKILIMKQAQQGQMPNQMMADGGRIEYDNGGDVMMASDPGMGEGPFMLEEYLDAVRDGFNGSYEDFIDQIDKSPWDYAAQGGRIGAQEGGLMDLGGQEKDYRDEGGFVALGGEERADDVPARLSKNEFVFTADAVRNAGGGDIDRGSEVMQNLMDNLEAGGEVSEDSQGLEGGEEIMSEEMVEDINPAQRMYDNYEQLQSRVA